MGLLEEGAKWLESQRLEALSAPAVYLRRNGEKIKVNATIGKTLFRAENEYGITIRTESRDFLISADEFPAEPERGDMVLYDGRRYEVLAPNGEPVWRWSGTSRLVKRIHTKDMGEINNGE